MAEPDITSAGIGARQSGTPAGDGKPELPDDDPRRAYARRAEDLLAPEAEVGLQELRGQEALDDLLERLTPVFEDAVSGLAVVSLDGKLLRVNRALASLLGRRRGELEGVNWRDLSRPEEVAATEERALRALGENERTFEMFGRFSRPDGEIRWARATFSTILDGIEQPVGLLAEFHDITFPMRLEERERASRAELELRRSIAAAANQAQDLEHAMATAIERICSYTGWQVGHVHLVTVDGNLISTGIWHFARPGQGAIRESLRFGSFNPRLSPPGEVLRTGKAVWLPDTTAVEGFAAAATARDRGLTGWAGFPITAGSDCVGVLEFYAALPDQPGAGVLELMTDVGTQLGRVTERRRAEDLRVEILDRELSLNSWFRSLLQSTGEGVCGLDLDGRVSFVNRAGAELLGYTPEEMQGMDLHPAIHHTRADGTPYPREECPILRASRTGVGVRRDTEVFWGRDGAPFPVEYSSHAIVDVGGGIQGLVLTFSDITDRRREEQAVRALNLALLNTKDELEQANLLKSDFLATMSHELRTPLNAIMGFAGLMQGGLAGEVSEIGHDYQERISRNAGVLLALINDVLDLSRIEANRMPLSPRVLDVRVIMRQVIENMQSLADNKGLQLELQDFTHEATVMAHQRAVHQILTNLISNAIKFTDQGTVSMQVNSDGASTLIEIADSGHGIAAEDQVMIFEAFRQVGAHARTGTGGTGLGLAISKRLARELGGDLTVQSDPGLGSRFTVELVSARVTPGLLHDTGPTPRPVVLWVTSDFFSTQRVRDWVAAFGMAFVGMASTDLLVKAALEMRPALVALDLPQEVIRDILARVRDEPKLNPVPVLLVNDEEVPEAELRANVWQMRRPFGPDQLHQAMQASMPNRDPTP